MPKAEDHCCTTTDKQQNDWHLRIAVANLVVSFLTLVVLAFTLADVGRYANEAHTQTGLFSKANDNAQTVFRDSERPHVFIDDIQLNGTLKPGYLSVNVSFINSGKMSGIHLQLQATKLETGLSCPDPELQLGLFNARLASDIAPDQHHIAVIKPDAAVSVRMISDIRDGALKLYVWGTFFYRDEFDRRLNISNPLLLGVRSTNDFRGARDIIALPTIGPPVYIASDVLPNVCAYGCRLRGA